MNDTYAPPFTMTEEITNLVIEIGAQVGVVVTYDALQPKPKLRRESRIKSIHSSLAIEQNIRYKLQSITFYVLEEYYKNYVRKDGNYFYRYSGERQIDLLP